MPDQPTPQPTAADRGQSLAGLAVFLGLIGSTFASTNGFGVSERFPIIIWIMALVAIGCGIAAVVVRRTAAVMFPAVAGVLFGFMTIAILML